MPKISVIVPVFNSDRYLKKTISALITQDISELEIILVDDGSTDDSLRICHKYAEQDARVKCIHTDNKGAGHARNIGMKYARGDWFAFCDADDIPEQSMYRKLYLKASETMADMCICDFYSERDKKNMGFPWEQDFFVGEDVYNVFMASMIGNISDNIKDVPLWGSVCRGIYKRTIIEDYCVSFPEDISFAEDLIFNLRYIMHCDKISVLRESLYYYVFNVASVMNSHSCRYVKDMFEKRKKLVYYMEKILDETGADNLMRLRLKTTERCYYSECVGNACTKAIERSVPDMIRETKSIMFDPNTCEAFQYYDAKKLKKRLLYFVMRYRLVYIAFVYYRIRFFMREK